MVTGVPMMVTGVPIVIGQLKTVPKDLKRGLEELEIGERIKIIQNIGLLRLSRILRKVLETGRDLLSFVLQSKTIS